MILRHLEIQFSVGSVQNKDPFHPQRPHSKQITSKAQDSDVGVESHFPDIAFMGGVPNMHIFIYVALEVCMPRGCGLVWFFERFGDNQLPRPRADVMGGRAFCGMLTPGVGALLHPFWHYDPTTDAKIITM